MVYSLLSFFHGVLYCCKLASMIALSFVQKHGTILLWLQMGFYIFSERKTKLFSKPLPESEPSMNKEVCYLSKNEREGAWGRKKFHFFLLNKHISRAIVCTKYECYIPKKSLTSPVPKHLFVFHEFIQFWLCRN